MQEVKNLDKNVITLDTSYQSITFTATAKDAPKDFTYQWKLYAGEGIPFEDATSDNLASSEKNNTFNPIFSTSGSYTLYVAILNNKEVVKASSKKSPVKLTVTVPKIVDAATPTVSITGGKTDYPFGTTTFEPLIVTASTTDGGSLSYKWYKTTASTATGGEEVTEEDGTIDATNKGKFTPKVEGKYYCVVVNTLESETGSKTAEKATSIAVVKCLSEEGKPIVDAATPSVSIAGGKTDYPFGTTTFEPLIVTASTTDGGVLSYKWYKTTADTATGGEEVTSTDGTIDTENKGKFTPLKEGKYYCVVTNTLDAATGSKTAEGTTSIAIVAITKTSLTVNITGVPTTSIKVSGEMPTFRVQVSPSVNITSYKWKLNNEEIGENSTYIPSGLTKGSYSLTVTITTDNSGIEVKEVTSSAVSFEIINDNEEVKVTAAETPRIKTQPISKENYPEDATSFDTLIVEIEEITDGGVINYQWYKGSVPSTDATEANKVTEDRREGNIKISKYTPTAPGSYFVVVSNYLAAATVTKTASVPSSVAVVKKLVNAATPSVSIAGGKTDYAFGTTTFNPLIVTASTSDGGVLSYKWYKTTADTATGGEEVTSTDGTVDTTNKGKFTPKVEGKYYCVVTNTKENATGRNTAEKATSIAEVKCLPDPTKPSLTITSTPAISDTDTVTIDTATPITFTVTATGFKSAPASFKWKITTKNTETYTDAGATTSTYNITHLDAGSYKVKVSAEEGGETVESTQIITLTVEQAISATPTVTDADKGEEKIDCNEDLTGMPDITVTATTTTGTLSYKWYKTTETTATGGSEVTSGDGTVDANNANKFTPNVEGSFYCKVTNTETYKTPTTANSRLYTIKAVEDTIAITVADNIENSPYQFDYTGSFTVTPTVTIKKQDGKPGTVDTTKIKYQWQKLTDSAGKETWEDIEGETNETLTLTYTATGDAGASGGGADSGGTGGTDATTTPTGEGNLGQYKCVVTYDKEGTAESVTRAESKVAKVMVLYNYFMIDPNYVTATGEGGKDDSGNGKAQFFKAQDIATYGHEVDYSYTFIASAETNGTGTDKRWNKGAVSFKLCVLQGTVDDNSKISTDGDNFTFGGSNSDNTKTSLLYGYNTSSSNGVNLPIKKDAAAGTNSLLSYVIPKDTVTLHVKVTYDDTDTKPISAVSYVMGTEGWKEYKVTRLPDWWGNKDNDKDVLQYLWVWKDEDASGEKGRFIKATLNGTTLTFQAPNSINRAIAVRGKEGMKDDNVSFGNGDSNIHNKTSNITISSDTTDISSQFKSVSITGIPDSYKGDNSYRVWCYKKENGSTVGSSKYIMATLTVGEANNNTLYFITSSADGINFCNTLYYTANPPQEGSTSWTAGGGQSIDLDITSNTAAYQAKTGS